MTKKRVKSIQKHCKAMIRVWECLHLKIFDKYYSKRPDVKEKGLKND